MDASILLARLIGPILVVVGLTVLANPRTLQDVAEEFLRSRALIFLAGMLTLLAGLAIVNTHSVWTLGWPVFITVFGWLSIVGGIVRIAAPGWVVSIGRAMLGRRALLRPIGVVQLALGAFLMFVGYA
jgi:hypothetical protein